MKRNVFVPILLTIISVFAIAPVASAAPKTTAAAGTNNQVGMDVSWPQCGKALPTTPAFGIVGVNGGTASTQNQCLATQLAWAKGLSGSVASQDKVQVYLNTANPGEIISQVTTWPTSNTAPIANPYGPCDGTNTTACSWQYGWNRADYGVNYFTAEAAKAGLTNTSASAYKWWLDVETGNTWQSGSTAAYQRNVASLEGWADYFKNIGARTGIYSTGYQWGQITNGAVSATSNLNGLHSWLAGAKTLNGAKSNCSNPPLTTGGVVALTQYVSAGFDYNNSCI
ncbi:MAG TPA: hypothetical protein VM124_03630 [Candidatus Limnocylindrales bacterium]|nr:hypothetical protein [Candidatus Limnocylindrales bacterium]